MAAQRLPLWAAESDLENPNDVDIPLAMAAYSSTDIYDDPQLDEGTQSQTAQQTTVAIPDPVRRVSIPLDHAWTSFMPFQFLVHFRQAVQDNNLQEITLAYDSGWNQVTEKFYAKTEWPEAEAVAPLVDDDQIFLILYRELYYRHVYSRLQPDIDDRFHSYENSCELFNYLLSRSDQLAVFGRWLMHSFRFRWRSSSSLAPCSVALGHHR